MYSVYTDKVGALMGSLSLKTTVLLGSLSQFCHILAQPQTPVMAVLEAPPGGVPSSPYSSTWQCPLACTALPGAAGDPPAGRNPRPGLKKATLLLLCS